MGAPGSAIPPETDPGDEERRAAASTSPVAVVWCRQVDNEAESPGYTTVPEEFPGHRETLEAIRIVGNLTVNVADTHDYWDPDPTQPLSYYPNLFLYPAFNGRYTCVGRMFLSTEDRPRLGMKTLVLDTDQLLRSGEFGPTVLRWHASMGGARKEAPRPSAPPDPNLYSVVGEAFLFHRGSTEPVVLVASDQWEAAMLAVLDLVRLLPASLTALGAILAFPYFLPQPKTNVHELTEQIPLSLALMRVPKSEAVGERHRKRLQSWQSAPVTVRDVTDGVPGSANRGKETLPLVLQYIRDHQEEKIAPIRQRVDLVELSRLRSHLADPERQGGKDRRKEIWRIGTAMESAALLLQKARGRHVPVNVETARRAQEYLQVKMPPPGADESPETAVVVPAPALPSEAAGAGPLPPWLKPPNEAVPAPPPSAGPEVVPVSVSEDPSLLPAAARGSAGARVSEPSRGAPGPELDARIRELRDGLSQQVAKSLSEVDRRFAELARDWQAGLDARAPVEREALLKAVEARLQEVVGQASLRGSTDLEARVKSFLAQHQAQLATRESDAAQSLRVILERRISELAEAQARALETAKAEMAKRLEELDPKVRTAVAAALSASLGAEVDRRLAAQLDPRVAQGLQKVADQTKAALESLRTSLLGEVEKATGLARSRAAEFEEEMRTGLSAQLDLHLREAADRELGVQEQLEGRLRELIQERLGEAATVRQKELKELEQRVSLLIDGRARELQDRVAKVALEQGSKGLTGLEGRLAQAEARFTSSLEARGAELQDQQVHAIAELQVRLQSHFEEKLAESQQREREKYLELLARLRGEVDAALHKAQDTTRGEAAVRDRVQRSFEAARGDIQRFIDQKVAQAADRLRSEATEGVQRVELVESALAEKGADLERLETALRAELDDLDRRTEVLSERLVPVVRKAWLKISDLERSGPGAPDVEAKVGQLKREVTRELRRLEGELAERTGELRDRMETAIANQGRVWLTLIRQLTQLTDDRRALERGRAGGSTGPSWSEGGPEPVPEPASDAEVATSLDVAEGAGERRRPRRAAH